MNKNILLTLIVILVLTACTPSESQIATSAAATELASPSDTPKPSFTPSPAATITPSITPTETPTLTPTPDLRVVDADPRSMLLSLEDLPEGAGYFSTGESPHRNWELTRDYGEEIASAYIESSGRIDGWSLGFRTYSKEPNTAEFLNSTIVIFSTNAGPETEGMGLNQVSMCGSSFHDEIRTIDIGIDASLCYIHLNFSGVGFFDHYSVSGSYRNILFGVSANGSENTLSEDIVIDLAEILVNKIKSFPLVDEVTYTAY